MTMTGAERQRQYRAKAKANEELATLNVLIATDTLAQLKRLASEAGWNQRQTLERIIGDAFAALQSDAPRPETTLQSDTALLSDEPLQSDESLQSDAPRPETSDRVSASEPRRKKIPPETKAQIRERFANGATPSVVASEFGISESSARGVRDAKKRALDRRRKLYG
jgi:hypothetical protein